MTRSTLWRWVVAGVLGVAFAGTANADPWDRDRDNGGRMSRMQELRERLDARSQVGRPNLERTITGREIGRETVQRGDVYREFRDRAEMMSQLNTQTQLRGSAAAGATADDGATGRQFANAGRETSNPVEFNAKSKPARDREFQSREQMMSQLNTQTKIRGSATAAATADEGGTGRTFANAGRETSDPSKLTDEQRQGLIAAGFAGAAKRNKSTDIEDKTK